MALVVIFGSSIPASAAGKVYKWRAQTYAIPGSIDFKALEKTIAHLKKATGGRLDIKLYGAKALVGFTEMLEACGKGTFEVVHNPDAYAAGLDPGFAPIFSVVGLWEEPREVKIWLDSFGGNEIIKKTYAKYNVHHLGPTLIGAEPIMSQKPLRTLEDFKGLKIRTPAGLTSMLFKKLGAVPVPLGGGQVYSALDTGVIDAAEFVTVSINYSVALHEVTKYILWPSFHGPIAVVNWGVNMEAWNSLPDDLKAALEMMVYESDWNYDHKTAAADYGALEKMKEKGLVHTQLSEEDMAKVKRMSLEVAMEYKKKSPLADEVITSIINYLKLTGKLD